MKAQQPLIVTCPVCRRTFEFPAGLTEYVRSVNKIGCDDCVWAAVRRPDLVGSEQLAVGSWP